ncbi:hypothetical protein [Chelatococcus asaccharovorans]|uniref:Uncharacterized protein n=1 Tax=Chelatococcus asaccharovorans TaxID=28210 RepID=A0A2V3TTW7_9HYPH|nr:hypothetical protein [Chelatococcus asaccharovorans]MBS7706161.1 hypothetical protein [Chelatococcus asaccharovorans]PXW52536.1 hypothetical protein C7450_116110 [Chelatococcus asaccharovorans]CAH1660088.1 conserved hypothetical protein [Chelatococcus asaccharovorans]CAH1683941.1 conserved hypothetical protein [Chelatococcus asaccharovorans]
MAPEPLSRDDYVASYKTLLRNIIDRNPSGLRLRLAKELSTHKSFISQITNPADATPIPVKHLASLFRLCHFTADEEHLFMTFYQGAHPNRAPKLVSQDEEEVRFKTIKVEVPILADKSKQQALERYVANFARSLRHFV